MIPVLGLYVLLLIQYIMEELTAKEPITAIPPTLEQLQLDLQDIKSCLSELSDLQKLELLEIRKNRVVNSRRLSSVGNRLFQLLLFALLGGAGIYMYQELDTGTKSKLAESYISQVGSQVIPVAVGLLGAQQLIANRKEQARYKEEEAEDDQENEVLRKYLDKDKK